MLEITPSQQQQIDNLSLVVIDDNPYLHNENVITQRDIQKITAVLWGRKSITKQCTTGKTGQ